MIQNYLKAGYPALCLLTQEPHRAEQLLNCDHWQFYTWDCIQGIRKAGSTQVVDEIKDPVETINWLSMYKDTVLIANNLHLFLDIAEVIQAIQTGLLRWKGTGCALIMISPVIQMRPEIEKYFKTSAGVYQSRSIRCYLLCRSSNNCCPYLKILHPG